MAGPALGPLWGSASEATCLLDYSLGSSDQPSLDLVFSPLKIQIDREYMVRSHFAALLI